eukprot:Gb_13748 [translate_table: standard]
MKGTATYANLAIYFVQVQGLHKNGEHKEVFTDASPQTTAIQNHCILQYVVFPIGEQHVIYRFLQHLRCISIVVLLEDELKVNPKLLFYTALELQCSKEKFCMLHSVLQQVCESTSVVLLYFSSTSL